VNRHRRHPTVLSGVSVTSNAFAQPFHCPFGVCREAPARQPFHDPANYAATVGPLVEREGLTELGNAGSASGQSGVLFGKTTEFSRRRRAFQQL